MNKNEMKRIVAEQQDYLYNEIFSNGYRKSPDIVKLKKDIIVFKKTEVGIKEFYNDVITTLLIKKGTRVRFGLLSSDKHRAARAHVIDMVYQETGKKVKQSHSHSLWNNNFKYRIGKMVKPKTPFNIYDKECAPGIHFFLDRKEAESFFI